MLRRLILLGLVAAVLAPGTWVRSPAPVVDYEAPLRIAAFTPQGTFESESIVLDAAWRLTSSNTHFGGYSGLIALDDTRLLAGSDKARLLTLPIPGRGTGEAQMAFLKPTTKRHKEVQRELVDLEALTHDPDTGIIWAAYEFTETIERHAQNGLVTHRDPPEMQDWPDNGGPEVLQRLPDGRFLVLAENRESWLAEGTPGLLFERDPIEEQTPIAFRFPALGGLRPVDATMLPDGRVTILLRDILLSWPIRFRSALAIADPAEIAEGEVWDAEIIAWLSGSGLDANFEGLVAIPRKDGSAEIYVISDDNFSNLQETLLLRLIWSPD